MSACHRLWLLSFYRNPTFQRTAHTASRPPSGRGREVFDELPEGAYFDTPLQYAGRNLCNERNQGSSLLRKPGFQV